MLVEEIKQRQLTRTTQLTLRTHGLYICQRGLSGHTTLELEMPYEEVLPVRVARYGILPRLKWVMWGFFYVNSLLVPQLERRGIISTTTMLIIWGLMLLMSLVYLYGRRNWWQLFTLHTARTSVALADRPGQLAAHTAFAQTLVDRTHDYLRHHYASVNPLGIIDIQLQRLRWLRSLEVLTEAEATVLATRLTGRLTEEPLRSMGQDLEAPYVN